MIRAAATRWLSHGRACERLLDRFVQVMDSLDVMIDQRGHDPEIEGVRNMLTAKGTLAGMLVLCDLLKPVIQFSDYLQGGNINFSEVNKKLRDLVDELHVLTERFRASLTIHDDDLYFSKLQTLFDEIDDRTALGRRLRNEGVYNRQQVVEEVAVPITYWLINELEGAFHVHPVLKAFDTFELADVPNSLQELEDYKQDSMKSLAAHYGRPRIDIFKGHRTEAQPVHTEDVIVAEFSAFKRKMYMLKQRDEVPDLYEEMAGDRILQNSYPVMWFLVGLGRIIPSSTASVERVFSLMNSLCTPGRSSMAQGTLDALMRICVHHQRHTRLGENEISQIIDIFKNMKTRDLQL